MKGQLYATLPHGVELRELTPEAEAYVMDNLRDGDRNEYQLVASVHNVEDDDNQHACAIWKDDLLVGMWSSILMAGDNMFSTRRAWGFLTTHHVLSIWRLFVRMTRPVYQALWQLEDPWVTEAYIASWAGYDQALRWQKKILNVEERARFDVAGEEHVLFVAKREV